MDFILLFTLGTIQFPKIVHLPDKLNKVYDSETFRNLNKVANLISRIFYWGILTSWSGQNKNLKLQFHKKKFCDIPLVRLARQTFVVQFSPDQTMRTFNFKENSNRKSNSSISLITTFQCSAIGELKKNQSRKWDVILREMGKNMSLNLWLSVLTRNLGQRSRDKK